MVGGQEGMKTLRHRIADRLSKEQIRQNRQINKSRGDADIGNAGNPGPMDGLNGTTLQKIGIQRVTMIALDCANPPDFMSRNVTLAE